MLRINNAKSRLLCSAIMASSLTASAVDAKEISATKYEPRKAPTYTTKVDIFRNENQLFIDPRTGEIIKQPSSKLTEPEPPNTSADNPNQIPAVEQEPVLHPFDFFYANDDGSSALNAYLLSQLSMEIYSLALNEDDFQDELAIKFEPQGILDEDIEVLMDHDSGTELGVFTIGDAVVFSFRGTSAHGTTNPDRDKQIDLMDVPILVKVDDVECRVHEGFWVSTEAVFPWIAQRALQAHLAGKKIYLTGHSLGGAKATVIAARLHYDEQIPVQSLQTFGSPKVGDAKFQAVCSRVGPDDVKLAEVTERYVVLGDPATTFPDGEWIAGPGGIPMHIEYQHVGNTHNILPINGKSDNFEVMHDTGEIFFQPTASQWFGFLTGVGDSEHMWYDDAMLQEAIDDPSLVELKDILLEHESVVQPNASELDN